ncbi:hypothetical protein EPA93_07680 [Ktedonosporobacter rubrisoli]|uniref:Lantibiotic immunity ABC transporter MutG family permease subunit n=1 Tax=Ktedonosporobacter rubrisoli TaxID=2509675 RepID=A0A4P6JL43_KTERU|nr:ABC transporter permease [Ktedonosporobacter rubrisoli]QBD75894.1 hypothetical protein EPA93_07680 [Ktedonosporobacter rubrisoli]
MFLHAIRSELTKLHNTVAAWLTLLFPLSCAVLIFCYLYISHRLDWNNIASFLFGFWLTLWPAVGVAAQVGLAAEYELRSGDWRGLLVRPVKPAYLYGAKLVVLAGYLLVHSALLSGLALLGGLELHASGVIPWQTLIVVPLTTTIFSLPGLALSLWLACANGVGPALGVGGIGLLIGALLGGTSWGDGIWPWIPWAWPLRMLNQSAHLMSVATVQLVVGLLLVSVLLFGLLTAAGVNWFCQREH